MGEATFGVYANMHGYHVVRIQDGEARVVVDTGSDRQLAEQLRDWLTHADRIDQLLARHGLVDVPLDQMER